MPDLLIVEDDFYAAAGLSEHLERAGYNTHIVHNGTAAIACIPNGQFDLVLLDLVLPDMSGFDVLRSMREAGSTVPVIVTSALTDVVHRVTAMDQGADDFLTKPFVIAELIARLPAKLNPHVARFPVAQPLRIVVAERSVTFHGVPIQLTAREFDLLCALNQNPRVVRNTDELLRTVWGISADIKTFRVSQHVTTLRSKLRDAGVTDAIRTVRGKGWVWTLPNCLVQPDPV